MNTYHLTEEISRWAFEVHCREKTQWSIAFTNPTAGPWKTVKAQNKSGVFGEVYRFALEENRPDIILINDSLRLIVIVEAKDSLSKLVHETQDEKSVEVVDSLARSFHALRDNPFWGNRYTYPVITGLLWGAESEQPRDQILEVFNRYHNDAMGYASLETQVLFGIESNKGEDGTITCKLYLKAYGNEPPCPLKDLADSFRLPLTQI